MFDSINQFFIDFPTIGLALKIVGVVLLAWISLVITKRILLRLIHKISERTATQLDDVLIRHKVFSSAAQIVPAIIVFYAARLFEGYEKIIQKGVFVYVMIFLIIIIDKLLSSALDIYQTYPISRRRPIKGYVQLIKIFLYIIGGIFIFAFMLDKSPWGVLSGIGALTAVLMLVFKDTILSVVAGMQIATNDLLRRGDWIEMPAFGADGDVVDVALHTVKVQNFDKTIVAIPTHKFLDNTFKNWRGMSEYGGRRIKRSLQLDQSSIRFLTDEEIESFLKIDLIKDYIEQHRKAHEEFKKSNNIVTEDSPLDGMRLTNSNLFRAYALAFLKAHPKIHTSANYTLLVRQLEPSANGGLPIEIYCFTNDIAWGAYEDIQGDIFDHLLAAMPEFGLRAYQRNALVDARGK